MAMGYFDADAYAGTVSFRHVHQTYLVLSMPSRHIKSTNSPSASNRMPCRGSSR